MTNERFRYHTGEVVRVGDRVLSEGRLYAVVQQISLPGSREAEAECDVSGAVFIAENVNGIMNTFACHPLTEKDSIAWKTTVFLRRGTIVELPRGTGTVPWPYETALPGFFTTGKADDDGSD